MRLIDADALIKKAYSEIEGMDKLYKDFGTILEWLVDKMPIIEPKRKKAKWIKCENPMYSPFDGSDEYTYQCSICHMKNDKSTKYCPNCGAHMIG